MELFYLLTIVLILCVTQKAREQRARIALLARYLGRYTIERQMKELMEGYLGWLGERDETRRTTLRSGLGELEKSIAEQFERFAADIAALSAPLAQVSKLAFWIPYAQPLLSARHLFDVRQAMAIHARGIAAAHYNERGLDAKAQAYGMTAELMLMQHTCHWFCRSRTVASARLLAQHNTSHAQVLDAVSPATARDYRKLVLIER